MIDRCKRWLRCGVVLLAMLSFGGASPLYATAEELLQKAIYTEETVGNLEDAIKLYEQVIASGKEARHAAAQAQYRLGLCYQKQQKEDLAQQAFQAVVDNYADESDLVKLAQKQLPSAMQLVPEPWRDGEALHFTMKLVNGLEIGTMIYMVQSGKLEGHDVWECSTRGLITLDGSNSFSRVLCDKGSFAPLKSHWLHSKLGVADAQYGDGTVAIELKGKGGPTKLDVTAPIWDNEQGMELFRRLPLQVGYKTTIPIVSTLVASKVNLKVDVPEKATIEVPAGKFECYKLVLDIGQTFWISADEHRYVVRFEAAGVVADLVRVEQRRSHETAPVKYEGMSFQLPPGWNTFAAKAVPAEVKKRLALLDPAGLTHSEIVIGPISTLKEEQRASARAWSETFAKELAPRLTNFKLREPAAPERKVGTESAITVQADFKEGDMEMTIVGIGWFHGDQAMHLRVSAPKESFETMRADINALLDSVTLE